MTRLYKEPKPTPTMGICGVLTVIGGLWLLFNPTSDGTDIINLHTVIVGQTLTICGTILCAIQWR